MGSLTVGEQVVALLSGLKEETILCDENGKVIGRFKPALTQAELHAKYGHIWDLEEIERRAKETTGGLTLKEIWKELRGEEPQRTTLSSGIRAPGMNWPGCGPPPPFGRRSLTRPTGLTLN